MKIIYYIGIISALLVTSSCNDWLNITPDEQIAEDELFKTGLGYETAINGIYQELSESDLYGQQLSWGLLSVLAQQYTGSGNTAYKDAIKYDYGTTDLSPVIDNIWKKMYNGIANCNNLLQRIESADPSIFELKELEKNVIQGEAYALRGMLHLDLLRLFAPAPKPDDKNAYLAYIQSYPLLFASKQNTEDYLKLVIQDLKKGKDLVATCDTLEEFSGWIDNTSARLEGYTDGSDRGLFFTYRSTRMNYYVITALLARAYQYANLPDEAYKQAKEVLDLEYEFTSIYDLNPWDKEDADRKMHEDILLAFFNNSIQEYLKGFTENGTQGTLPLNDLTGIFGKDDDDYRKQFLTMELSKGGWISLRWQESNNTGTARIQRPLIPLIRLSEMYYIAGESIFDKDPDLAMEYLNEVRTGRGCLSTLSATKEKSIYQDYIINEARREFMSEGQTFFFYKRLNKSVLGAPDPGKVNLVFPIPASNDALF